VKRALVGAMVIGLWACDDFGKPGNCVDSARCYEGPVCSRTNPLFVEDPWFVDAGEAPHAVWVNQSAAWVGTDKGSIYRSVDGGWFQELAGTDVGGSFTGIASLWGLPAAPQFAGAWSGDVESYSEGSWASVNATGGATGGVLAFSGLSGDDVWAAAQGNAFHLQSGVWSGQSFSTENWQGVWVSPARDIWVVGGNDNQAAVLNLDGGTSPTQLSVAGSQLESVWGSSATDVWAVGTSGSQAIFCHFDGSVWAPCSGTQTSSGHAYGVWGLASDDVWASADGYIFHFDGSQWNQVGIDFADGGRDLYRIWGNGGQVWAAGETVVHCP
jgi:hypothetical protein